MGSDIEKIAVIIIGNKKDLKEREKTDLSGRIPSMRREGWGNGMTT